MRKVRILLVFLILFSTAVAGCRSKPKPTPAPALPTVAAPAPTTAPVAPVDPTSVLSPADEPIYLAIIWHQHQPLYFKDPATNVYAKPWVRAHAAKDYVDMATTLAKYPTVKATFNLTPSLIRQLDDLAAGAKDLYQVMAEIPADQLTAADKIFIEARFFDANPKIVARFPRYQELANRRGDRENWTDADWRDLQLLFSLAWTDPDWLAEQPLMGLVEKGRDFSEVDKQIVFEAHRELVSQVIPVHRALQEAGQIEVTMTPYTHPILPLLVTTQLARVAAPDITLPSEPFIYGQDAVAQIARGIEFYQDHFGRSPTGMWPAEGAVTQEIVGMVSRGGIRWMASDEEVLAASLGLSGFARDAGELVKDANTLYRPYYVTNRRDEPVAILFRDKTISNKVGFTYSGMPGDVAANDFIGRIQTIRDRLAEADAAGPHLVSVILDGENAWEHYDNDGKLFLETLYQLLSDDKDIVTITPSEYIARFPEMPVIEQLWPGSWISPDFKTWIGEEEENTAWDYLARTRAFVAPYERGIRKIEPEKLARAMDLIYAAEGSDWFWWYGADQNSGNDESFDEQFRATLGEIWDTLGEERPIWLSVPIIAKHPEAPEVGASALIQPQIDGVAAADDEWLGAGRFDFQGGVMASSKDVLERFFYGFDSEHLYLRVDATRDWAAIAGDAGDQGATLGLYLTMPGGGAANPFSRYGKGRTLLGFGAQALVEVTFTRDGLTAQLTRADGANGWIKTAQLDAVAASSNILELAVPLAFLGQPDTGDLLTMRLVQSAHGADQTSIPADSPALISVSDLGLSTIVLTVADPERDDRGPGTYTYPTDPVFPGQAYDLKNFEVAYDATSVLFKFTFYGKLNNAWGAPNGLGIHTLDVYVDQDGLAGSGLRKLLPGRNAAVPAADAWDFAIWAEGWYPGLYRAGAEGPEEVQGELAVLTDPSQSKITLKAPKSIIGADPENWRYLAVVMGQEGYPSTGVWRVRDINASAAQWRFGGAPADTNHTRIIDIALPADRVPDQFTALSGYPPSQEADMDSLGPDDFAQAPMVGVE